MNDMSWADDEEAKAREFDEVAFIIRGRSVPAAVEMLEQRYPWLRHSDIRMFVSRERFKVRQNKAGDAAALVRNFIDRALDTKPREQQPPAATEPSWWRRLISRLTGGSP